MTEVNAINITMWVEKPKVNRFERAVQFMYEHAGYSYDPKVESAEEGRLRCAKEMAKAEEWAFDNDWTVEWSADPMGCQWGEDCCDGPHKTEDALLMDANGDVLGSLSGICGATREYRRVVEAELALEAMPDGLDGEK